MQDAMVKLGRKECEDILADVNPLVTGGMFDVQTATILGQELSFYPGWKLLEIADYQSVPAARRFAVYKKGDAVLLDWTSASVYALNSRAPIMLGERSVADYLRFFFSYVKGKNGRFLLCESIDDVIWSEEPAPSARGAVARAIRPLTILGRRKDGSFLTELCLLYKNALFKTHVTVDGKGVVTMGEQTLLIDDMPVVDDLLGQ